MLHWIITNLPTIIVCAVLIFITAMIVAHVIKNKKHGKTCCGCEGCAMRGSCHEKH